MLLNTQTLTETYNVQILSCKCNNKSHFLMEITTSMWVILDMKLIFIGAATRALKMLEILQGLYKALRLLRPDDLPVATNEIYQIQTTDL